MSETALVERASYGDYRPSGQGWIGEIPAHWHVERIKHVARLLSGHTPSRKVEAYWENATVPWVTLADVGPLRSEAIDVIETTSEKVSEIGIAQSSARVLPKDTVVLSRTASVGFSGVLGAPMATSQDYFNWVCGPRLRPKYLLYCFRAMREEFRRVIDGSTHQTIYWPDAERLTIPLPPLDEQDAIIAFLDRERERIDRLVALKERLLELLGERAESLVTSVCLGEGHEPTSDDPAYGWLPPTPAGWELVPLKRVAPFISVGNAPQYVETGGTPVLGQSCIYWEGLRLENARLHAETQIAGLKGLLQRGDVVLNTTGTGTMGRAAVFDLEGTYMVDDHVAIVRTRKRLLRPAYIVYLLRKAGYQAFLDQVLTIGATDQTRLLRGKLTGAPILLPPLEVQDEIVGRLASELGPNSEVQQKTRRHLELLREHRRAVTIAAVTGRVRCS